MEPMCKGHFLTLVAKDALVRTHGSPTADWPPENFWAMVSTVKSSITDDQIPGLLKKYPSVKLNDFPIGEEL